MIMILILLLRGELRQALRCGMLRGVNCLLAQTGYI